MSLPGILLSILGLAPFIGCGLAALGSNPAVADRMLTGLIAWAALTLTYVGGLHWGLLLRNSEAEPATRRVQLGLALLPAVVGWLALVLPLVAGAWLALLLLILAYAGALLLEHQPGIRTMLPPRYLLLRWSFTVVAVAMLTTVLTLRLLGQTIVL